MIDSIEGLILKHFRTIPFHNLNLLYGTPAENRIPGGTCSDKTLLFLNDARQNNLDVHLHSAYINNKEIHRLVRIIIDGRVYFADIGNGWPTLKLIPSEEETTFHCFGMRYRTEIIDNCIHVFHTKRDSESLQIKIDKTPRPENTILNQIKSRFNSGINYPFSNELRFSLVKGDKFLFLRGNQLETYSNSGCKRRRVDEEKIPLLIKQEFGFDVLLYFET